MKVERKSAAFDTKKVMVSATAAEAAIALSSSVCILTAVRAARLAATGAWRPFATTGELRIIVPCMVVAVKASAAATKARRKAREAMFDKMSISRLNCRCARDTCSVSELGKLWAWHTRQVLGLVVPTTSTLAEHIGRI